MRPPFTLSAAITILSVGLLAACTDDASHLRAPTQPSLAKNPPPGGECSSALAKQIDTEINGLWANQLQTTAKRMFATVQADCPVTAASAKAKATDDMLAYVQFTIDNFASAQDPDGSGGKTTAEWMVSHWNSLFAFVGQTAPNILAGALSANGAARVFGPSGGSLIVPLQAGYQIPSNQTATGSHLYTIAPLGSPCLPGDLDESGRCVEFSVNPVITFDPAVTVALCENPAIATPAYLHIGHQVSTTETRLAVKDESSFGELVCHPSTESSSASGAGGAWFARLARQVADVFRVQPLYASHTLTSSTKTFSPFSAVDNRTFVADFTKDPVGPFTDTLADKGSWTKIFATAPGSIAIQTSLANLTDKPVVLSQGGGNCSACGGLELRGRVTTASGSYPTYGTYVVHWSSVQAKPTLKSAPFVLRAADSSIVARFAYATRSSHNLLTYAKRGTGNKVTDDSVATWSQNVAQEIAITVNLDAKTTSLSIGGTPVAGAQNVPFVASSATSLKLLAAEFSGIDAGTVGWDNITITRSDDTSP